MKIIMVWATVFALPAQADTVGSVTSNLKGHTLHWYDASHGNQVEFLAENGSLYLWYPGNRQIVQGAWKVQSGKTCGPDSEGFWACKPSSKPDVCFKFPPNSSNPVTKKTGGNWECSPWDNLRKTLIEKRPSDIYDLTGKRKVPFRMTKKRTSMSELESKLKGKRK